MAMSFDPSAANTPASSSRMVRLWPLGLAMGLGALALWWLPPPAEPPLSPLAALGRELFHDPSLSASGQQS